MMKYRLLEKIRPRGKRKWTGESREKTYAWSSTSHKDQSTKVRGTFSRHGTIDSQKSSDTISLEGGPSQRRAPSGSGTGGLTRLEEFLLGVGGLGFLVGVAEDGGQDCQAGAVGEDGA